MPLAVCEQELRAEGAEQTLRGAMAWTDPPGLLQVTWIMGLPNACWGFPAGWGSLLLLNCSPKAKGACETLEILGCQMFSFSRGGMMCSAQGGPNLGLYVCTEGPAWALAAINLLCLQSGQVEAVPRLVLGAFSEPELQLPVLRHMWIMAMGKELKEGHCPHFQSELGADRTSFSCHGLWGPADMG